MGEPPRLRSTTRRRVYEALLAAHPAALTREQVADRAGVSRALAAFHLDRLAAAGLIVRSRARRPGGSGPGGGRPANLYALGPEASEATEGRRRYDLLAEILLAGLRERRGRAALEAVAARRGSELAAGGASLLDLLAACGYDPARTGGEIRLRNCPFDRLARNDPELVCALNRALVGGLAGATRGTARAEARPEPGCCCVVVTGLGS